MTLSNAVFTQLDLEQLAVDRYRGFCTDHGSRRVFGGQVLGQALLAAARSVEGRPCHSLHTYFLRPADPEQPIDYEVDRMRDGGSFSMRRVVAMQKGKAIMSMSASFQAFEQGLEHQIDMPDVPGPEGLATSAEKYERTLAEFPEAPEHLVRMVYGERPVDVRIVEDFDYFKPKKMPAVRHVWYRSKKKLGQDILRHQCLLAYASDVSFLSTGNMPHGKSAVTGMSMASIDHAIWFHRSFNLDDWILIAMDSPAAASSRSFVRGSIFTRDGTLVGSVAQEGLTRQVK